MTNVECLVSRLVAEKSAFQRNLAKCFPVFLTSDRISGNNRQICPNQSFTHFPRICSFFAISGCVLHYGENARFKINVIFIYISINKDVLSLFRSRSLALSLSLSLPAYRDF